MKVQLEQVRERLQKVKVFNELHPLTNFEIMKLFYYYENESKFNGVYSRNSLRKIKDGAYIINLDEHKSRVFHWISL